MSLLLHFRKLGIEASLRVDDPELEPLALGLQSSARTGIERGSRNAHAELIWGGGPQEQWHIRLKDALWREPALSREELFLQSDGLLDDLVRERLGDQPMLHAGAVIHPNGDALVLCGASGAGKTSLVTECVLNGWGWLSDERLCFRQPDPFLAEGFRRNFNLKQRSFRLFPEIESLPGTREVIRPHTGKPVRFFDPEEIGRGRYQASGRVRVVVAPRFNAAARCPIVNPLGGVDLVNLMVPELRSSEHRTACWIAPFVNGIAGYSLEYSTPRGLSEVLLGLMAPERAPALP